jgi:hypothetical protein
MMVPVLTTPIDAATAAPATVGVHVVGDVARRTRALAAPPAPIVSRPTAVPGAESQWKRKRNGRSDHRPFACTCESLEREREKIRETRLRPDVRTWVDEYSRLGRRPMYLWQWCQRGVQAVTLPCVPPEMRGPLCDAKVLAGMLNVLLDDVTDQQRNGDLLKELLRISAGGTPDLTAFDTVDREYGEFTFRVWREFWARVEEYPCFHVFRDLLCYDLEQLFNTVRYSELVNRNLCLLNLVEHDLYSPHGMMITAFATMDLMCAPGFRIEELGRLRQTLWHAEWMARIGNLVTTWQREIADGDFTSGVFARAVVHGELGIDDLVPAQAERIRSVIAHGDYEGHYLRRWRYHRRQIRRMRPVLSCVDVDAIIRGLQRLLQMELASRGSK